MSLPHGDEDGKRGDTDQDSHAAGNMLRCGCPLGRPCTCEMGSLTRKSLADVTYACGECVNCRLNAVKKATRKSSTATSAAASDASSKRRCIRYSEYVRNQQYECVELGPECVFKMRRPDWNVDEKSAFFNQMRQMRLAMLETQEVSTTLIEKQKQARKKLNRDLAKAKEVLKSHEALEKTTTTPTNRGRRTAIDYSHVDSDVFDSFSKQLIPVETLLPEVRARLEKVNLSITNEEKSIKIIRRYVYGFAATKLQQSVRDFLRNRRWKHAWQDFKADTHLAAALEIQATYRMLQARRTRWFLEELRRNRRKEDAAETICRFFRCICIARRADADKMMEEARRQAQARKLDALLMLERACNRVLCREALLQWREKQRQSTAHAQMRSLGSAVAIQRMYRGYRDRLYLKRIRLLNTLSSRVRELVDQFLVSGNFWGFVMEIDADYRRFEHEKRVEEEHALTFVSTLLRQRKLEEDQMMQEWFTASAMQSPIVHGARQTHSTYSKDSASPASTGSLASSESTLSQALLESPVAADLIALSPNKRKADVFPADLPSKVIRHAMAKGFAFEDIVAVLRGLQAQMKDIHDVNLVVKTLYQRTPLMTTPWKSERQVRQESHPHYFASESTSNISVGTTKPISKLKSKMDHHTVGSRNQTSPIKPQSTPEPFISENLVDSIPGGMNAPIARIVLVAALKSFDPDADGGDGAFTLPEDFTTDPFQSYQHLESPLLKVRLSAEYAAFEGIGADHLTLTFSMPQIRREQQVLGATKPFIQIFTENRCLTGYDVLYNVRGVDELVAWKVPKPLALSIYDVIEEIHRQTTHLSRRNIKREMYISPEFDRFLRDRSSATPKATPKDKVREQTQQRNASRPTSPSASSLKDQIRERLEKDVLMLPIQNADLAAAEVLFKAAFLACDTSSKQHPSPNAAFDAFLDSLVSFQMKGDSLVLKQLIRERVEVARQVADGYAASLQASGVRNAADLLTRARLVDAKLESILAEKVRELLAPISEQVAETAKAWTPKSKLAQRGEPQGTKSSAQLLSPLVRQGKIAIGTLGDDIEKIKLPS